MSSYRLSCASNALSGEPVSSEEGQRYVDLALQALKRAIEAEKALEDEEEEEEEEEEEALEDEDENPWELYSRVPGWADASARIGEVVDQACVKIGLLSAEPTASGADPEDVADRVWSKDVAPVLRELAEFGATDSEPVQKTRAALEEAARAVLKD